MAESDSSDFDTCKERTRQAVIALRERGVDARWIQVAGMTVSAPDADPRWADVPDDARIHYVMKIDDQYHDLAPNQFWPDSPTPLIETDYLTRWERSYDITDALHH